MLFYFLPYFHTLFNMFDFDRMYNGDLERILMYAANKYVSSLKVWKALLPLLGVCQQWTRMLYPVIYYKAFIHYSRHDRYMFGRRRGWESNINCMAIRSCYNVVRILEIRIDIPADELLVLNNLETLLQLSKIDWFQIHTLYIYIDGFNMKETSRTTNKVESRLVEFTQRLIAQMPNIIDIEVQQIHEGYALQSFSQTLVNAYALQLQRLHLWPVVTLPTVDLGSSLTFLDLCFYNDHDYDYNLSVFAESLCVLQMTCLPFNTPWYMFYGNSRGGLINFKSLYKLRLSYYQIEYKNKSGQRIKPSARRVMSKTNRSPRNHITSIVDIEYRYEIYFPKLKILEVSHCFEEPDVINAKFGSTLALFKLHGNIDHIEKWAAIQLRSQRFNVFPTLHLNYNSTMNIEILNNLFGKPGNHRVRELTLIETLSHEQVSLISWHYLNKLDASLDKLKQLLELLPRMPRLSKLSSRAISIDRTNMSNDEVNNLFKLYIDTPDFDLRLKELHLYTIGGLSFGTTFLAIVYNFIIRTKLLTRLTVPKQILATVQNIINTQENVYPHFANICVN